MSFEKEGTKGKKKRFKATTKNISSGDEETESNSGKDKR